MQVNGKVFAILAAAACLTGQGLRSPEKTIPSPEGYTIYQSLVDISLGQPSELNGLTRRVSHAADGRDGVSTDYSAKSLPDHPNNRVIFWPVQKIRASVTDAWQAIETTRNPDTEGLDVTFRWGSRTPENHCMLAVGAFEDKFVGYDNLQGIRAAHVTRTKKTEEGRFMMVVDHWFWEEAGCLILQTANNTYHPASETLTTINGWKLDSVANGRVEADIFDLPDSYKEGSMQKFYKERVLSKYGRAMFDDSNDPYNRLKAERPTPK